MSDLSAAQILEIRRNWIRDEWLDSPTFKGISQYNRETLTAFFTDPQLEAIDDFIANEYAEELASFQTEKYYERIALGDTAADALTSAETSTLNARYRLIRAESLERMRNDPGYRRSMDKGDYEVWTQVINADRNFFTARGGRLGFVRLARR